VIRELERELEEWWVFISCWRARFQVFGVCVLGSPSCCCGFLLCVVVIWLLDVCLASSLGWLICFECWVSWRLGDYWRDENERASWRYDQCMGRVRCQMEEVEVVNEIVKFGRLCRYHLALSAIGRVVMSTNITKTTHLEGSYGMSVADAWSDDLANKIQCLPRRNAPWTGSGQRRQFFVVLLWTRT